jgi:hypothetical protein
MRTYQLQLFNYAKPRPRLFKAEHFEAMDDESAKAEALAQFDKLLLKRRQPDKPNLDRFKLYTDGLRLIAEVTAKDRRRQLNPTRVRSPRPVSAEISPPRS